MTLRLEALVYCDPPRLLLRPDALICLDFTPMPCPPRRLFPGCSSSHTSWRVVDPTRLDEGAGRSYYFGLPWRIHALESVIYEQSEMKLSLLIPLVGETMELLQEGYQIGPKPSNLFGSSRKKTLAWKTIINTLISRNITGTLNSSQNNYLVPKNNMVSKYNSKIVLLIVKSNGIHVPKRHVFMRSNTVVLDCTIVTYARSDSIDDLKIS
jgi:hypothetical protein